MFGYEEELQDKIDKLKAENEKLKLSLSIKRQIELVKNDILQRFPNCSHTIEILLWDDGTNRVECRHGNDEGTKIYTSSYYNNELTYNEIDIDGKVMVKDKFGNEKFYYLTDEKPKLSQ